MEELEELKGRVGVGNGGETAGLGLASEFKRKEKDSMTCPMNTWEMNIREVEVEKGGKRDQIYGRRSCLEEEKAPNCNGPPFEHGI